MLSQRNWLIRFLAASLLAMGCTKASDPADLAPAKISRGPKIDSPAAEAAAGGIPVYFSEVWQTVSANRANPHSIADACVRTIESAQKTLDVCCHEIDNKKIIDAIVQAQQRGVRVRVVTEQDYTDDLGPQTFRQVGIPVLTDNRSELMHNKFMVIDEHLVWTGSFNFTENCAYKNNNNAVVLDDGKLAANYTEKFRWFWDEHKFGGRPGRNFKIPYPVVTLRDGTVVENYFSTHDKVDEHVIEAIRAARRSIKFLAFSYTHQGIARAMIDRAEAGVKVAGVVETRQNSQHSMFERLNRQPGVEVLLDGNPFNMHHKVIIVDDAVVITGSFNFSTSAAHGNDENIVIIHNPKVAARFDEEFQRVYRAAQNAVAAGAGSSPRR